MIFESLVKSALVIFFSVIAAPAAYSATSPKKEPVKEILKLLSEKSGMVPQAIYQYKYKGKVVYLAEMPCCDHYNILFSKNVVEICSPSGGFAGNGDGKCADFEEKKSSKKLLWNPK